MVNKKNFKNGLINIFSAYTLLSAGAGFLVIIYCSSAFIFTNFTLEKLRLVSGLLMLTPFGIYIYFIFLFLAIGALFFLLSMFRNETVKNNSSVSRLKMYSTCMSLWMQKSVFYFLSLLGTILFLVLILNML